MYCTNACVYNETPHYLQVIGYVCTSDHTTEYQTIEITDKICRIWASSRVKINWYIAFGYWSDRNAHMLDLTKPHVYCTGLPPFMSCDNKEKAN